jgi:hypothetical protein
MFNLSSSYKKRSSSTFIKQGVLDVATNNEMSYQIPYAANSSPTRLMQGDAQCSCVCN